MANSKSEQILGAIKTLLHSVRPTGVVRNAAVPESVPDGGLIVVRDGDPGEPDMALGGFGNIYYSHAVEIEVYLEEGDNAARDASFDELVQAIGGVLESDPTLGGLAFGMTYGRPEIETQAVSGAAAIKAGVITLIVEYATSSPLG
ncbi:MAG: acyl-CoA transferase [Chloroflexi bacterium]|nr:acyl-CoA transferase [Chloroflexota bacterium]